MSAFVKFVAVAAIRTEHPLLPRIDRGEIVHINGATVRARDVEIHLPSLRGQVGRLLVEPTPEVLATIKQEEEREAHDREWRKRLRAGRVARPRPPRLDGASTRSRPIKKP